MTVNFGILGAGRIAKIHCENIFNNPKAEIIKIYDINNKFSKNLAKKYNTYACSKDLDIFTDPNINAIVIASSTPTHVKYLDLAKQYNKDVYCEKPIHLDLKTVDVCLKRLVNHKNKIQIGFHRRFDENHIELKKRLTSKKYGDIEQINISSRDSGLPPISYLKVSGGIFKDMTIHDLDILRWLLNDEIDEVFAQGSVMIDSKVKTVPDYDTASMILKSKKGILAQISNSRRQTGGFDQRIEVYCKKGNLNLTNIKKTSVQEINSKSEVFDNYPLSFIERYKESYVRAIDYFINCINKNIKPYPGLLDGRNSLAIAQALTESAKKSKTVKVNLI
ncbi:Gfo/Idh/MocA family oxidoreductase [Pelagibacterales bacterium SAG-MED31]|nr:Gfo/Idh/MocA family oxidoreductase [Pelagibacterales bacterium SAG-MED31]